MRIGGYKWWVALLWFIVGGLLGQHFSHKAHPSSTVRQANGGQ